MYSNQALALLKLGSGYDTLHQISSLNSDPVSQIAPVTRSAR